MNLAKASNIFKAFSDEKRLKIIKILSEGELCACELLEEFNFSQSGLSYQMKILCDSNIVNARPEGKWTFYSINEEGCFEAIESLKNITNLKEL